MRIFTFDTETVDGEPFTLQFAGAGGAILHRVSRDTILPTSIVFLLEKGQDGQATLLFAHNLEFDLGVVFITHREIWRKLRFDMEFDIGNGLRVELQFNFAGSPYARLNVAGRRWLLVDTMNFFDMSLDRACELLKLPVRKLPQPAYLGQRTPSEDEWPAFERYALNDAGATYALGQFILDRHEEFGIVPTVSIAQMAAVIFRTHFLRGARIPFCELEPGCNELLEASLLSYHGGKNGLYVQPGVYGDVAEVDIVSAYPDAMKALPPLTAGRWRRVKEYVPGAAAVYRVCGRVKRPCRYGVFIEPRHGPNKRVRKIHHGEFDTWVTGWELESALAEISLDSVEGFVWQPGPGAVNPFADYVDYFFRLKQNAPREDPRREMYKLLLNSLYGKTIQQTQEDGRWVAGGLFNPFWAAQITGHCRARLHQLEHEFDALHASTDSILTRATSIRTGSGLGDLDLKARGRLVVVRSNFYLILDAKGQILKRALHGFRGSGATLLALLRRGERQYTVMHMVRPREALRTGEKPFRMVERTFTLRVPEADLRRILEALRES